MGQLGHRALSRLVSRTRAGLSGARTAWGSLDRLPVWTEVFSEKEGTSQRIATPQGRRAWALDSGSPVLDILLDVLTDA